MGLFIAAAVIWVDSSELSGVCGSNKGFDEYLFFCKSHKVALNFSKNRTCFTDFLIFLLIYFLGTKLVIKFMINWLRLIWNWILRRLHWVKTFSQSTQLAHLWNIDLKGAADDLKSILFAVQFLSNFFQNKKP